MANIENAQVVNWANSRARTICDKAVSMLNAILAYQADYAAQGIAAAIAADPAGASAKIDDGSVSGGAFPNQPATGDGRASITGTQLTNLLACLNQLQVAWNTTNVTGVGSPPTTTINAVQVNGSVR